MSAEKNRKIAPKKKKKKKDIRGIVIQKCNSQWNLLGNNTTYRDRYLLVIIRFETAWTVNCGKRDHEEMIAIQKLKQRQQLMLPISRIVLQRLEYQLRFSGTGKRIVSANPYSTRALSRKYPDSSSAIQDSYKQCMSKVASQAMIVTCGIPMKKKDIEKTEGLDDAYEPILRNLHGSTVSSVLSLSVSPRTLILLNLQIPSATSECSHRHGWIAVHLLPSNNENSVRLIREFSKGSKYLKNKNGGGSEKNDIQANEELNRGHVSVMEKTDKVTLPFNWLRHDDFIFSSQIYEHNKRTASDDGAGGCQAVKNHHERETIAEKFHSVNGEKSMEQMASKGIEIPILSAAERVLICEKDQVFRVDDHEIWVCEVKDVLVSHTHSEDASSTGGVLFYNRGFHGLGEQIKKSQS